MVRKPWGRKLTILVSALLILFSPTTTASATGTLFFNNSNGSYPAWNQGAGYIYLNEITGVAGSVITQVGVAWASSVTTQASSVTVYIFNDSSGTPTTQATTFTYASNDGATWAYFNGSYTVPSGGKFFIGLSSATMTISNAGSNVTNQAGTSWSINYTSRWSASTPAGPFTNNAINTAPMYKLLGSSTTQLNSPSAPNVSNYSSGSISVSESAATPNASSYVINVYASDGTTFVESATATSAAITTPTILSGLTPNTSYKVSVTAIGDGVSYSNSNASNQTSITLSLGTTSITISAVSTKFQFAHFTNSLIATLTGSDGKVTFYYNGKKIYGCTQLTSSALSVSCNWKPTTHGSAQITAYLTPTSANYAASTSSAFVVSVASRTAAHGS